MSEIERKKSRVKWIGVGIIIGVVAIASFLVLLNPLSRILNPPRPEIVSKYGHDGFQGLNYVLFVDVTVRNNGGEGWIKVLADISGAGRYEKKEQRIYLINGESKSLNFVFDISFLGTLFSLGNIEYRAWANAD